MKEYQTPCYVIDKSKLGENCEVFETSFGKCWGRNVIFAYSVKTNNHDMVLQIIKKRRWAMEVVSWDEYRYIKEKNYAMPMTICNGPVKGKMLEEVWEENHIINLDNMCEVIEICDLIARGTGVLRAKIGLRVNYDFDKKCPNQRASEVKDSRFGLCYENGELKTAIELLRKWDIPVSGLHMHTSTKTRSTNVFKELANMAGCIAEEFNLPIEYIDIGGGFFGGQILQGKPTMEEYAETIGDELKKFFAPEKVTLILEPGAAVVATAIQYVTTVSNIRDIRGVRMVTLDGTLLHINPFMVSRRAKLQTFATGNKDICNQLLCGCTCMENDLFGSLENGKELKIGDKVVCDNAGAYTMSFNSNFILNPPQVYLKGKENI